MTAAADTARELLRELRGEVEAFGDATTFVDINVSISKIDAIRAALGELEAALKESQEFAADLDAAFHRCRSESAALAGLGAGESP